MCTKPRLAVPLPPAADFAELAASKTLASSAKHSVLLLPIGAVMAALDASMAALAIDASPYTVRIGIMGCASIAKKNARAIIRSERCTLVAVASRELPKAEAFCDELKLDRSVQQPWIRSVYQIQGYDALLADKGIMPCIYHSQQNCTRSGF